MVSYKYNPQKLYIFGPYGLGLAIIESSEYGVPCNGDQKDLVKECEDHLALFKKNRSFQMMHE